jgi:hypothetical protein
MYWMENLNMLLVWDMEPDIEPFICRCSHWPWGWLLENPACAGERLLGRRRRRMLNDWRYQPGAESPVILLLGWRHAHQLASYAAL